MNRSRVPSDRDLAGGQVQILVEASHITSSGWNRTNVSLMLARVAANVYAEHDVLAVVRPAWILIVRRAADIDNGRRREPVRRDGAYGAVKDSLRSITPDKHNAASVGRPVQFDYCRRLRLIALEVFQGFVEGQHIVSLTVLNKVLFGDLALAAIPPMPQAALSADIVHENPPHGFSRSRKEMAPTVPTPDVVDVGQPQIRFVYQRSGLQSLTGFFASHLGGGQFPRFVVYERQQLRGGLGSPCSICARTRVTSPAHLRSHFTISQVDA